MKKYRYFVIKKNTIKIYFLSTVLNKIVCIKDINYFWNGNLKWKKHAYKRRWCLLWSLFENKLPDKKYSTSILYLFKLYVTIQLQGRLGSFYFLSKNCLMGWVLIGSIKRLQYIEVTLEEYRLRVFIKRKDYITKLRC